MGEERSSVPHIQGARLCHLVTSPSSSRSLHGYHARGGESIKDQAEGFMGSLETVLIGFILLSRAQSHGPTVLQGSLGNIVLLSTQERNGIALWST